MTCLTRGSRRAGIGVDLGQQTRLGGEIDHPERVQIGVERAVGAGGRLGERALMPAGDGAHRRRGAPDRRLGEFGGMRIAGRLAGDRAQPETLRRVERGALDPAVVERDAFRLAVFEEQLAVVHARERLADKPLDASRIHAGAREKQVVGDGEI